MSARPWLSLLRELYAPPSPEEARRQNEAYGKLLVELGLATRDQIEQFLRQPDGDGRLTQFLINKGTLSADQLANSVVARAAEDPDNRVAGTVLVGNLRGDTWKAWDTSRRDWVQLTFISDGDASLLRKRAAVAHPGLAAIFDVGRADGRDYVVFESVPGITLAAAPRTDPRRLIAAVADAAEGLAALQAAKLAHGGITMETVVLAERGKLTGWGSGKDDVRALAGALYEVLTDRPAPKEGIPKAWPRRLGKDLRSLFEKALGNRRFTAKAFAEGLRSL